MLSFESDYLTGAHPKILQRLIETNLETLSGYGADHYCTSAKEKIAKACGCPDAQVEFLEGGTQTNAVIVSTMLKDYEGVICATTGHLNTHEAGAIEYTGNKVMLVPHKDGKISAQMLKQYITDFYNDGNHEHMVFPGMTYISQPTEYGTLYTKKELTDIADVCHEYKIPLFVDGARLGYGLMSRTNDVSLEDLAEICDVFYIGGTKVGALCGEAVVFTKHNRPDHFVNQMKKRGALMAKGRVLGVQFDTLFTDNLYMEISKHAIDMAEEMKALFKSKNIQIFLESPTNQQFIVLDNKKAEELSKHVVLNFWEKYDETHTVYRFATCWSTTEEDIKALAAVL